MIATKVISSKNIYSENNEISKTSSDVKYSGSSTGLNCPL